MDPPAFIYMGKDKDENEHLIEHGFEEDVWFHVDKLSSAHVYLRLNPGESWETIPKPLLDDLAQLVKANSIEGDKKDNLTIIYTPWSNLKKTGDMAVGQVGFKKNKMVKRVHVATRINTVVNRLYKNHTVIEKKASELKQEKAVHETAKRTQSRQKEQERQREEYERVQQWKQQASERSYASMFEDADMAGNSNYRNLDHDGDPTSLEDDFM